MLDEIDLSKIEDSETQRLVLKLLDRLESSLHRIDLLQAENQALQDEINRLKGEQGKPAIKPPAPKKDYSSRQHYRRSPKKGKEKGSKNARLRVAITRTEKLVVEQQSLPKDAVFKGYEQVIVQEVIFRPEVICFQKEKFYSPSEQMTYLAKLPEGFEGQFGPGLIALVLQLYYQAGLSEPKLHQLLTTFGFLVSPAQISKWLIERYQPIFGAEKQEVTKAGLASTTYHHFDHTGTRGRGQNLACHILCNPYYTTFTTLEKKDRLSVLRVLLGEAELGFIYNTLTAELLEKMGLAAKWRKALANLAPAPDQFPTEKILVEWLKVRLPKLSQVNCKLVVDAFAIAAYQTQTGWPIVDTLVCDDAPQFNYLTRQLALCWIHEGRHYNKLEPHSTDHRNILTGWLKSFWGFYDQLLLYSQKPDPATKAFLVRRFEEVFTPNGDYHELDEQIRKSRAKREQLLAVLEQPGLPLHNNPAELGARQRVRKLDVSLAVFTEKGLAAWDSLQTVVATCLKLGVNVYHYLFDRISGKRQMKSLATLIGERSRAGPSVSYYPSEKSRAKSKLARAKHKLERKRKANPADGKAAPIVAPELPHSEPVAPQPPPRPKPVKPKVAPTKVARPLPLAGPVVLLPRQATALRSSGLF